MAGMLCVVTLCCEKYIVTYSAMVTIVMAKHDHSKPIGHIENCVADGPSTLTLLAYVQSYAPHWV